MSGVTVPTPFSADELLYIASGCSRSSLRPVYAIRPGAAGDTSLPAGSNTNAHVAWSQRRAAPYVTSPLVYDGLLYVLLDNGFLAAYDACTGEEVYGKQRFTAGTPAFSASPWAYDGNVFCLSESGDTYVVAAGPEFRVLHVNHLDEAALATPAVVRDSLVLRTLTRLFRIANIPGTSSSTRQDFTVENTRIAQRIDSDKFTLDIWTDGSINPNDALSMAAKVLRDHFSLFIRFEETFEEEVEEVVDEDIARITIAFFSNDAWPERAAPFFKVALAAQNIAQRMTWDDALRSHEATFTDDDFDSADLTELLDRFADTPLDPSGVSLPTFEAARGLFTQAYFPTVYRAGVGWEGIHGTRVELDASAVSPRGRQSAPWEQRVSAGVEQRLKFLVLRGGYALAETYALKGEFTQARATMEQILAVDIRFRDVSQKVVEYRNKEKD